MVSGHTYTNMRKERVRVICIRDELRFKLRELRHIYSMNNCSEVPLHLPLSSYPFSSPISYSFTRRTWIYTTLDSDNSSCVSVLKILNRQVYQAEDAICISYLVMHCSSCSGDCSHGSSCDPCCCSGFPFANASSSWLCSKDGSYSPCHPPKAGKDSSFKA